MSDAVRPAVKICGLTRPEDARAAVAAGADYLGAVLSRGFDRSVSPSLVRTLPAGEGARRVGVLVDEPAEVAARMAADAGVAVLQLHGDEPPETLRALRAAGPWRLWKAVRPRAAGDILAAAERYRDVADALLVDGWHPDLRGGAGVRFPWTMLEEVRRRLPADLAVVAAGGLTPYNVGEAVARLDPDVVDVSSGVESEIGRKDRALVDAFVAAAKGAAAAAAPPEERDRGRT